MSSGSLISPYLDALADNVRARPIPWEGYARAGLITDDELRNIKSIDRSKKRQVEDVTAWARLIRDILERVKRVDIQQYVLVLAADLLSNGENDGFASALRGEQPWDALTRLMGDSEDETVALLSLRVQLLIAGTGDGDNGATEDAIHKIQDYCRKIAGIHDANEDLQNLAAQALSSVLRTSASRKAFWSHGENKTLLKTMLARESIQLRYNTLLVVWLLSFDREIAKQLDDSLSLISVLDQVLRTSTKEKITRVALSILGNLSRDNLRKMMDLQQPIETLTNRRWNDLDIQQDLETLKEALERQQKELTTFDQYVSEIESGKLTWTSPVHRDSTFWQENAKKLEENDNKVLKQLARLMATAGGSTSLSSTSNGQNGGPSDNSSTSKSSKSPSSTTNITLAIAANDIGQFVKANPEGRTSVQKLGAKSKVMELMGHSDADVRYEALNTVQILLSRSW
ncbi:H(+)-transporting V1 sector ATPase subunit H [Savitreella phatthalungensis]